MRRTNDVCVWHFDAYSRIGGLEAGADVIGLSKMGVSGIALAIVEVTVGNSMASALYPK